MKRKIIIVGALLAALLFAGCSDVFNPPKLDISGAEGQLVVQLDGDARTLAPTDLTGLTYKLLIYRGNDDVAYSGPITPGEAAVHNLETGGWNVIVEAYKGDTLVADAPTYVTIMKGETTNVSLTLTPVNNTDVKGTFKFNVTYPSFVIIDSVSTYLTLTPVNPNSGTFSVDMPQEASATNLSGTQELPAGEYTMTLSLVSNRVAHDKTLTVSRKETVYIYPGLETNYTVTFTEADFTAHMVISGRVRFVDLNGDTITDYIPSKASLYKTGDNDYTGGIVQVVDVSNDYYEFELASHEFESSANQANIEFIAKSTSNENIILNTGARKVIIDNMQGTFNAYTEVTVIPLTNIVLPITTSGSVAVNGNAAEEPLIAREGNVEVKITTPDNYGLIKSTLKLNGAEPNEAVEVEDDNTITADFYYVGSGQTSVTLEGDFFHLKGDMTLVNNTEGYIPTKIEAFEPGGTSIGSYTIPANAAAPYSWEIPIPKGYMWESSIMNVRLVTTLAATGLDNKTRETTVDIRDLTTNAAEADITVSAGAVTPLNAPTSFFVSSTSKNYDGSLSSVTLSWDFVTNASGYIIERSINDGAWEIITETGGWTSFYFDYVTTLVNAEINYRITTKGELSYSNSTSRELDSPVIAPTTLNTPTSFYVSSTDTSSGYLSSVTLNWDWVTNASGYIIERSIDNGTWTTIANTGGTTFYTDNVSLVNAEINYRITTKGEGSYANSTSPRQLASPVTAPDVNNYININHNQRYAETINYGGEKKLYILNSGAYSYVYLYDSSNPDVGGEIDMKIDIYSYNPSTNEVYYSYSGDDNVDGAYIQTNYQPLLIVVRAFDPSNTGSFSFQIDTYY